MTTYQLTLEAKPQVDDPDGARRIRMALKRLLRSFGLRCIRVEPVTKPVVTGVVAGTAARADAANAEVSSAPPTFTVPVTGTSRRLRPKESPR